MYGADDLFMCLVAINGYLGKHIDRFDGFHEWYGEGLENFEGWISLEFCVGQELCVSNT